MTYDKNELRLYRDAPPAPEPGADPARWIVAPGVEIIEDTPRRIDPPTVSAEALLAAVDAAAARIFGHGHRAAFDRAAGVRPGSLNQWVRRDQIPPPRLVAWLAWVSSHPKPEEVGHALRLVIACGDRAESRVAVARRALAEARK
ncbi:hypothetical protein [Roseovarius sp. SYSU LYC5161]|uniref:hypothetical protein n=1 Tax=Roseovarius halophilus (ex Wu et al. 2025) TaxID=3376060 RepID=UPI003999F5C7